MAFQKYGKFISNMKANQKNALSYLYVKAYKVIAIVTALINI
jgi:hypothetical protein